MKNLINKNFDNLNNLPSKITSRKISKLTRCWETYKMGNTHPTNGISVYNRVQRIIKSFVNKPANDAFSHFVKQVPKYQQFVFWDSLDDHYPRRRSVRGSYYYSDENGIIRFHDERKKRIYSYNSPDYAFEFRHKITGHKKPYDYWKYKTIKKNGFYRYCKVYKIKVKGYPLYEALEDDFEMIVISGKTYNFESSKDPRFVRYNTEKAKQRKKADKERRKKREEESLEKLRLMYEKEKERRKKERDENLLKIIKHGFDPITSFRTEKQTNPDLIQLKQ